jgi:hypothetical protein
MTWNSIILVYTARPESAVKPEPHIETRNKKHQRHVRLDQPHKSAVAEHFINLGHRINLQDTTIPSTKPTYMDWIMSGANKTEQHPNNMKREDSLPLSRSLKPLNHTLRGQDAAGIGCSVASPYLTAKPTSVLPVENPGPCYLYHSSLHLSPCPPIKSNHPKQPTDQPKKAN